MRFGFFGVVEGISVGVGGKENDRQLPGLAAQLTQFGQPVMDRFADAPSNTYLRDGLEQTGAANIVTAILLDFRAYDTLGEATVLFCAVMGALTVLRRQAKAETGPANQEQET